MSSRDEISVAVSSLTVRLRRQHDTVRSLREFVVNRLRRSALAVEWFDALADVTFRVGRGQMLAVIGPNGAGKTTLLRAVAGIVPPSSGSIRVRGAVAPLIELGGGFDPELTGAENALLFASLLGASRKAVRTRLGSIARFAGLEDAMDVAVRNYSSGMVARLGFSVATELEPDVLLVDEVLAVGDEAFRARCRDRISTLRSRGASIVLVTHDLQMARDQADAALLLERGRVVALGSPEVVTSDYLGRVGQ